MTAMRFGSPRMAAWLRHAPVIILGGLYLYAIGLKATRAALWFDEITTYHVANLGGPGKIIEALLAKADNHPPLDYLARHLSMSLFGPSELAFRLPSVFAMLVAAVCLYLIVLRRTSVLPALVAFSFPFITFALKYSYEGRPYAFLIASVCLAFLAWQRATDRPSVSRFVFLTLCLSLGPHVHYYGVLNYLPIAVGEAWRSWERWQISWPIVGCFGASFAIVAVLVPFVLHAADFSAHFWTRFGPASALLIYAELFDDLLPAAVAVLIGCAVVVFFFRVESDVRTELPTIPRHEIAAALALCLVPITTFVLAKLITHAYADKYLINTVVGVGLVVAYLVSLLQARRQSFAVLIALVVAVWAAGKLAYIWRFVPSHPPEVAAADLRLLETAKQPVAIFKAHGFLQTHFYLPPALRDKIYYLTDTKLTLENEGIDTNEIVFQNLMPYVPIQVVNLCEFTKQHHRFLILLEEPTWVVPQLLKDHAEVKLIAETPIKSEVLDVTLSGPSGC